ncbi:MAG: chloride channel protein [Deltaproteobacteria bacterium]|nr:chloride channel protein [Deltaproteobacteria bacterium]
MADVVESVALRGGRMNLKDSLLTAAVASVILGTGGGGGREDRFMRVGAAPASTLAKLADVPASRLRVPAAAGPSAGIAKSFNTPIAAAFSREILLGSFCRGHVCAHRPPPCRDDRPGVSGRPPALVLPPFSAEPRGDLHLPGPAAVGAPVSAGFKATVFHISDAVQTMRR